MSGHRKKVLIPLLSWESLKSQEAQDYAIDSSPGQWSIYLIKEKSPRVGSIKPNQPNVSMSALVVSGVSSVPKIDGIKQWIQGSVRE